MLKTLLLLLVAIPVGLSQPLNFEPGSKSQKISTTFHRIPLSAVPRSIFGPEYNDDDIENDETADGNDDKKLFNSFADALKDMLLGFEVQFYKVVGGIEKNLFRVNFLIKPTEIIKEDVKDSTSDGSKTETNAGISSRKIIKENSEPLENLLRLFGGSSSVIPSQLMDATSSNTREEEESCGKGEGNETDKEIAEKFKNILRGGSQKIGHLPYFSGDEIPKEITYTKRSKRTYVEIPVTADNGNEDDNSEDSDGIPVVISDSLGDLLSNLLKYK